MKGFPAGCLGHLASIKSLHYQSLYLHGLLTKFSFPFFYSVTQFSLFTVLQ